jgi:hypothetical protein
MKRGQTFRIAGPSLEEEQQKIEQDFKKKQEEDLEALRANMEKEKEKLLADEKRKLDAALEAAVTSNLDASERDQMIQQHEANMKKLEGYMDKEKARQESDLAAQVPAQIPLIACSSKLGVVVVT